VITLKTKKDNRHMGVTPPFLMLNNNTDKVSKMKQTPRETREILERYNLVVGHLIQEGYAQDKESADHIITGMSEEWFEMIVKR
tara:strand:- start:4019 stop:4270 length:252 start_codon:yes stop_codon:yes gene_type:complete